MRRIRTRLAAVLLALVMCLTLLPVTALADTEGDWQYTVEGGKATVTRYYGSDSVVTVPSTLGGYPVTAIGDRAFDSAGAADVTVPQGVVSIGDQAFSGSRITAIHLPASLTSIGDNAFSSCRNLFSFHIPAGVTRLGRRFLRGNDNLTSVTVDSANTAFKVVDGVIFSKDGKTLVWYSDNIPGPYTVPSGVETLAEAAFSGCSGVNELTLPASLRTIGAEALRGIGISELNIPAGVTSIDPAFLSTDNGLDTITVAAGNTAYKAVDNALLTRDGKTLLRVADQKTGAYTVPSGVTAIGDYAFYSSDLSSITLPSGLKSIGDYAFGTASYLRALTLPSGLQSIGEFAFYNSNLERIAIPAGVTAIAPYAFDNCTALADVSLPAGLMTVGEHAFYGCNGLTDVVIPAGVTAIGDYAFAECSALRSVVIPAGASVAGDAFNGCLALADVYYTGTQAQWDAMVGGFGSTNPLRTATLHLISSTGVTVTRQPVDAVGAAGDPFTLTVRAAGSGLTWQWQYWDGSAWKNSSASSAVTDTLTGTLTAAANGRRYRCRISDAAGHSVYSAEAALLVRTLDSALNVSGGTLHFETSALDTETGYYPWTPGVIEGRVCAVSGNTGVHSSYSDLTLTVNLTSAASLSFYYRVWGEGTGYDYGRFTIDGQDQFQYGELRNDWTLYETALPAGEHTLKWRYRKDGSTHGPGDYFALSDVSLTLTPVAISLQPEDFTGAVGETFSFHVEAQGSDLTYQWQYWDGSAWKNSSLASARTDTLTGAVTASTIGNRYRCKVSDNAGHSVFSAEATLLETPLSIKTSPGWRDGALGETVEFTVEALGSSLTYQWQVRINNEWKNSGASSARTRTLAVTVTDDLLEQNYRYRCIITDRTGNTVTTDAVGVNEIDARIDREPPALVGCTPGTPFSVTVAARGSGLTYQWQYWNGSAWVSTGLSGNKTATVTGTYSAALAGRRLRCQVTDRYGNTTVSEPTTLLESSGLDLALNVPGGALHFETSPLDVDAGFYPWVGYNAGGERFAGNGNTGVHSSYSDLTLTVTLLKDTTISFDVKIRGEGASYDYGRFQVDNDTIFTYGQGGDVWTHVEQPVTAGEHTFTWRYRKDGSTHCPGDCFWLKNVQFGAGAVVTPLAIVEQPVGYIGAVGSAASFSVAATGEGLTYQWQYKAPGGSWTNSGAASAKTANLTFTVASGHNGNQYRCIVKDNKGGSVTSNAVTLTVGAALSITTQPKSAAVASGSNASFTVKATGTGLTYQWQYLAPDGAWKNSGASSARTATLSFNASTAQNGYQYRCVVKDSAGNTATSGAATLTVTAPALTVTTQPRSATVAAGANASFTLKAAGAGLTYQWQVKTPTGAWKNSGASGAKTATLSFNAAAAYNGYQYRCVVKDSSGKTLTSHVAMLTVSGVNPVVVTQPEAASVTAGGKAAFTLEAAGVGLTYQWQYLAPGGSWKNSGASGAKTATLSFNATAAYNGYKYRCIVKDSGGRSVTSGTAALTVTGGVAVTTQPANATVAAGSRAAFSVTAAGTGLTYQWQYLAPGGAWKNSGASSAKTASLSFNATAAYNGYKYRCVVKDGAGQSVTSNAATLTVSAGVAITQQPANVTVAPGGRAAYSVTATGEGLTYQWQYLAPDSSWKNSGASSARTATLSFNATAAQNGYQYRCVVKNADGASVTSNIAMLKVR